MKASFEFDFDLPDDKSAHYRCTVAQNMAFVINQLDDHLRVLMKYHELEQVEYDRVEKIRDYLRQCLSEYGIDMDSLLS
jgi:hypothetical protein